MVQVKRKPNVNNVDIRPVKWISPQLWSTVLGLFMSSYKTNTKKSGVRALPYEATKFTRLALAYDGDQMVGFVSIVDYDDLTRASTYTNVSDSELWNPNRPATLNRRQIELCWVNHRYQGQGLATRLYRHAIDKMGATHIHIDEHRVVDRIDYWRDLGFVKCSLYRINEDVPSTRLHLASDCEDLWDLNTFNITRMFDNRDMTPNYKGTRFARRAFT
jgi:GNAT superfamily N-acetyltransferase